MLSTDTWSVHHAINLLIVSWKANHGPEIIVSADDLTACAPVGTHCSTRQHRRKRFAAGAPFQGNPSSFCCCMLPSSAWLHVHVHVPGWMCPCLFFPKEQYFDWMNLHKQNFVCWPSGSPQGH